MKGYIEETLSNIESYIRTGTTHNDYAKKLGVRLGFCTKVEEENRTYFIDYIVSSFSESLTVEIHTGIHCEAYFLPALHDYITENGLERMCVVNKNGSVVFYVTQLLAERPVEEFVIFNMETDLMFFVSKEVSNIDRVAHGLKPLPKSEPSYSIRDMLKGIICKESNQEENTDISESEDGCALTEQLEELQRLLDEDDEAEKAEGA